MELTLGRFANVPPDFPTFHSDEKWTAKIETVKLRRVPPPRVCTHTRHTPLHLNIVYDQVFNFFVSFLKK